MERGDFILGQDVESFEAEFARYCRVGLSFTGATPIWVDCDLETYCIDVDAARRAVTKRTKAVIAVHLYSQPADMDAVQAMLACHGLKVVEDACQAHGHASAVVLPARWGTSRPSASIPPRTWARTATPAS